MTSTSVPHRLSTVGKRLFAISLMVILTCVIIGVVLQPVGTSAQAIEVTPTFTATPAADSKLLQPTPTPQSIQRSAMMAGADSAGYSEASFAGSPITATRGYSNLNVSLYNAAHLNSFLTTKVVSTPIDFHLECWNEDSPYSGCKLDSWINSGGNYSARWQGKLIVPESGLYTFRVADVDDGARLFIDSNQVITYSWDSTTQTTTNGSLYLNPGLHDITVDYENRLISVASLEVRWSGPSFDEEVIPMANRVPECDCTLHPNCCENEVGGPINTRTGNYDYAQQDISLSALGESLNFRRTYNSLKAGTPTLGYGWTHDYNVRLSTAPGGLTFQSCGGQQFSFMAHTSSGVAAYQGASGAGGIFTRTQTQPYLYYLTTPNNERYIFNYAGRLVLPISVKRLIRIRPGPQFQPAGRAPFLVALR